MKAIYNNGYIPEGLIGSIVIVMAKKSCEKECEQQEKINLKSYKDISKF